jgi:hypothetical protein
MIERGRGSDVLLGFVDPALVVEIPLAFSRRSYRAGSFEPVLSRSELVIGRLLERRLSSRHGRGS